MKIKVSSETFNEIAQALIADGRKLEKGNIIQIEKTDELSQPIDFVLAQKRYDCLSLALMMKEYSGATDVLEIANKMYNFMLKGELDKSVATAKKEEWK